MPDVTGNLFLNLNKSHLQGEKKAGVVPLKPHFLTHNLFHFAAELARDFNAETSLVHFAKLQSSDGISASLQNP